MKELNEQLESEKRQQLQQAQKASHSGSSTGASTRDGKDNWTDAEVQMLIKAVNLFPAGTSSRSAAFQFLKFFFILQYWIPSVP